jgi:D-alanyl-D-alanine carboxypeptidase/D-alanyl-D-alanine-endopeptidase (penicillin-binding protein 4)
MKSEFTISGSMPDPAYTCISELKQALDPDGFMADSVSYNSLKPAAPSTGTVIGSYDHLSPSLDSLVYWFLRKSVNLYGEALIRTIALQVPGRKATEGPESLKAFWVSNGIKASSLNLYDGSGLSPQNRVTTRALVQVLQYAAKQKWSASFYDALPTYNGMKMKSGSISGARAYAGYHHSTSGKKFVFAIVINNYSGSASAAVSKMYKVLDQLK